jgi:hypothetical protein
MPVHSLSPHPHHIFLATVTFDINLHNSKTATRASYVPHYQPFIFIPILRHQCSRLSGVMVYTHAND